MDQLKLGKTRWTRPSSRDDSVNSMKIDENIENNLITTNNPKINKKKCKFLEIPMKSQHKDDTHDGISKNNNKNPKNCRD